jgi:hypothetical protein
VKFKEIAMKTALAKQERRKGGKTPPLSVLSLYYLEVYE